MSIILQFRKRISGLDIMVDIGLHHPDSPSVKELLSQHFEVLLADRLQTQVSSDSPHPMPGQCRKIKAQSSCTTSR